jgi:hypothetical protein
MEEMAQNVKWNLSGMLERRVAKTRIPAPELPH